MHGEAAAYLDATRFDPATIGIDLHAAPGCSPQRPAELGIRLVVRTHSRSIVPLHAKDDSRTVASVDGACQFLHVTSSALGDRIREASQAIQDQSDGLDLYQAGRSIRRFQKKIEAA